jgi:hypothetical protein
MPVLAPWAAEPDDIGAIATPAVLGRAKLSTAAADVLNPIVVADTDPRLVGRELTANKGVADGYAGLGGDGWVPAAQLPPDWTNAKRHGAVGDGIANDRPAIAAALLAGAGGTVFLPAGVYRIEAPALIVPSNTELVGAGWSSVLLVDGDAPAFDPLFIAAGTHDVRLRDFAIDGNKAAIDTDSTVLDAPAQAIMAAGTIANPCERIYVEGVYVHDSARLGIVFQNVQAGAVRGCLVEDNERDGITVYFDSKEVVIADNTVRRSGDDGIAVNSGELPVLGLCEGITITGNTVLGPGSLEGEPVGRGMSVRGGKAITISGNTIRDTAQSGIVIGDFATVTLTDIAITGNVIERPGFTGATDKDGIRVECSSSNVQRLNIVGNTVRAAPHTGIKLVNANGVTADDDIRDVLIANNSVEDSTLVGIECGDYTGISDVLVQGNRVKGSGGSGIEATAAAKRIHVRNNVVYRGAAMGIRMRLTVGGSCEGNQVYDDRGGGATQTHGINVFGLSGTFAFGDNSVWGNVTADYLNDGAHSAAFPIPYRVLTATQNWNPPSVAVGASTTVNVTVAGAAVGDVARVSFASAFIGGCVLDAQVTAADTVTVTLANHTAAPVDFGNLALRVMVWKYL